MRALCILLLGGCVEVGGVTPALRVEPAAIDVTVELGAPPPVVPLRALLVHDDGTEQDVTAQTSFGLDGVPLGSVAGGVLVSDGLTGGTATVRASFDIYAGSAAAVVHVHGWRVADGTPAGAVAAFASAVPTAVDAHLDPQDGAVIPPDLGRMVLSFAAADADDAHEITVTAPYLDLAVIAPGAAGPRQLELTASEWGAITHTARGGAIDLAVASVQTSAPAASHVASAHLAIADFDASSLVMGGIASADEPPGLLRYDMHAGTAARLFAQPAGTCMGCHLAVSRDGARVSAVTFDSTAQQFVGLEVDAHSGAIVAKSDPTSTSQWASAGFDPGGALIGAWQGALTLRDPATGAERAPIAMPDTASTPQVSPDGTQLAYVTLDAGFGAAASQPAGNALRIRSWDAAHATVGPDVELVRDGGGVALPDFSSDGRWLAFGHTAIDPDRVNELPLRSSAIRTDGSGTQVALTADPLDQLAHWASPVGGNKEPMVWVAIVSKRPVGGAAASPQQLWLEAFYPERGTISPAFHLPGQSPDLQVLHEPLVLP